MAPFAALRVTPPRTACPPARLPACPPARPSACPPVRLSACPPVRLPACPPLPRERLRQPAIHGENRTRGEAELVAREQDGEVGDGLRRDEPYAQHVARAVRLQLLLFAQAAAG